MILHEVICPTPACRVWSWNPARLVFVNRTLLARCVQNHCKFLEFQQVLAQFKAAGCWESLYVSFSLFVFTGSTHQLRHSVDVDLALLQSSTEEHRCCHQKVVSYPVSVDIHGRNFAAVVGADLKVA